MDFKIVYLLAAFISLLALIFYYEINVSKVNKNYLLLFLTTLISNFGYAMYVHSDTLEAAMAGNLISYVGVTVKKRQKRQKPKKSATCG